MLDRILNYVSIFLALLILLPVHEFAHAFVAVKSGDNTPKLYNRYTLNPLAHFDPLGLVFFVLAGFGWAKPVPINPLNFKHYKRDSFFVSIAGVVANYILAFLAYPLAFLTLIYVPQFGYFTDVLFLSLYYIFRLGLVFFVFNLIPVYPLDGFRVVETFTKRRNKFYNFLVTYGRYILMGLFILSIISDYMDMPQIDILGRFINFVVGYISVPITEFWGLIF